MAKFDFEKGGRLSGLIGNIVIAGDNVRARPKNRDKEKWSPAQKQQRLRYKAVVALYRSLRERLIIPVWKFSERNNLTAYNLFLSENMHAFDREGNIPDPVLLKMSIGKLPVAFNMSVDTNYLNQILLSINWENDKLDNKSRMSDELVVIFFNFEYFSFPIYTGITRETKKAEVKYPENFGKGNYAYIFFASKKRDAFSESMAFEV